MAKAVLKEVGECKGWGAETAPGEERENSDGIGEAASGDVAVKGCEETRGGFSVLDATMGHRRRWPSSGTAVMPASGRRNCREVFDRRREREVAGNGAMVGTEEFI